MRYESGASYVGMEEASETLGMAQNELMKRVNGAIAVAPEAIARPSKGGETTIFLPYDAMASLRIGGRAWERGFDSPARMEYASRVDTELLKKGRAGQHFTDQEDIYVLSCYETCRKAIKWLERENGIRLRYARDFMGGLESGKYDSLMGRGAISLSAARGLLKKFGWLEDTEVSLAEAYVNSYTGFIKSTVFRRLRADERDEADDLLQLIMIHIIHKDLPRIDTCKIRGGRGINYIARCVKTTMNNYLSKERRIRGTFTSLDAPFGDDCDGEALTLMDQIPGKTPKPDGFEIDRGILPGLLAVLTPRQREIIELRYLGKSPMKLEEVSIAMGHGGKKITRERVRQIEKEALKKMREIAEAPRGT